MVANTAARRSPGRPQAFSPDEALDRAVEMFWEHGYEGVDMERIARAVSVTKPCLYREFGDKSALLLRAVERYVETYGAPMMKAFQAETDIRKAVAAFCETTVATATGNPRTGCLMAAAALGQSERVTEIRKYCARGLAASAELLTQRFQKEIAAKRLSARISAKVRGRVLIDMMQGILLRARVGVPREELLIDARSYATVVLI